MKNKSDIQNYSLENGNLKDNQTTENEVVENENTEQKKEAIKYLRVGTQYYHIAEMPTTKNPITGKYIIEIALLKWDKVTITDDHSKKFLYKIPKYKAFINIPSHIDYQQDINGFYNQYHKLKYQPQKGNCPTTLEFIKHIFGEQYELGLDYLAILYLYPTEILPILCLVSDERKTGKSTFIFWLNELFGSNSTINDNSDFESRFNSDWTTKLLIAVEETLIEKRTIYERIKSLSTAKSHKTEAKGKDKTEGKFFGKFILCSNFEDSFVPIDSKEIRFWVRKIPTFEVTGVEENVNMLATLTSEIPFFLHFLNERNVVSPKKTRMWFTESQIYTDALERLKKANMPKVHKALRNYIDEILELHNLDFVCYNLSQLMDILKEEGLKTVEKAYLKNVLQKDFLLEVEPNNWYFYYNEATEEGTPLRMKGRCYKFTREILGLPNKITLKKEVTENQVVNNNIDNPFIDSTELNTKNFTKDLFLK